MVSKSLRVRINIDNAERISELYGIGSELAKRIIEHRESQGYIHAPEDLAKVKGIKLELAITLAPHIDWIEPSKKRTFDLYLWFGLPILVLSMLLLLGYFIIDEINTIKFLLFFYQAGYHQIFSSIISTAVLIFSMVDLGIVGLNVAIIKRLSRPKHRKLSYRILWITIILLLVSGSYIFIDTELIIYEHDGLYGLVTAPVTIASIVLVAIGLPIAIPLFLVFWNPQNIANHKIARMFDIAAALAVIVMAVIIWAFGRYFSVWINFLTLLVGILVSTIGISLLRTGKSYFSLIVHQFVPTDFEVFSQENDWKFWINTRLPNPDEQKELKKALDEAYPPSKSRNFIGTLIIGGGGWLILTSLSAIIQWFVDKGLNTWFEKFFSK